MVSQTTRSNIHPISDQNAKIYTLFQTKMPKSIPYFRLEMRGNDTLWGGTYLYGDESTPLPPPPGRIESKHEFCIRKQKY